MSTTLKIVLAVVFLGALINLITAIIKIVPMSKRLKEIKRAKNSFNPISVEAEIVEIHTNPIGESGMDTEYDVKLHYEVGYQKFYKSFILVNKQALRVGQKLTLLCDGDNPEQALIQDFESELGESFQMKSTIVNIIVDIVIMAADTAITAFGYINGDP